MRRIQLSARQWATASLALIVGLIVGGTYLGYRHHLAHQPLQVDPHVTPAPHVPPPHVFAASGSSLYQFCDNMMQLGQFWITCPSFGASGDGATDATAAIVAADAAAEAYGTGSEVIFPSPAVAYKTTAELTPSIGATWRCISGGLSQCSLRASTTMRSVVAVHSTAVDTAHPNRFYGMTFDGNHLAKHALLRVGDANAIYDHCNFINALYGQRGALHRLPMALSAVTATVPGGSPSGVTISQPDLLYSGLAVNATSTLSLVIKSTAARGTATYALNLNGAGAAAATQVVQPSSEIDLTIGATYEQDTGIQVAFPAGTYHVNDHYDFTATTPVEDAASYNSAPNMNIHATDCAALTDGMCYATSGLISFINGLGIPNTAASGTVAITLGSQILQGTGTSFLSDNISEGSFIRTNAHHYQIASVLDDLQLALIAQDQPTFTASGLDYAIEAGAGYWEDGSANNLMANLENYRTQFSSIGMRLAGARGAIVTGGFAGEHSGPPWAVGSLNVQMFTSALFVHPYWEDGAFDGSAAATLYQTFPTVLGVTVFEPLNPWNFAGGGGYRLVSNGNETGNGVSNSVAINTLSFTDTPVNVTSSSQTLPVPSTTGNGNSSKITINPSASYVLNGAPVIAIPPQVGTVLWVEVSPATTFSITFQDGVGGVHLTSFQTVVWGGEHIIFKYSSAGWAQMFDVTRQYNGFFGAGSGNGAGSATVTTTNATPAALFQWPSVRNGLDLVTTVYARDTGSAASASWYGLEQSWDSTVTLDGPLRVQSIRGTNSGGPPTGWQAIWTTSGGIPTLQVTGVAATTIQWVAFPQAVSAQRF